jgi:DNA-binding response OmpR family regulator
VGADHRLRPAHARPLRRRVSEDGCAVSWPDTLRIILSGYTDAEDIIAGINEAGIYQYLLKPWQPESLLLTAAAPPPNVHRLQQENQRLSTSSCAPPSPSWRRAASKPSARRSSAPSHSTALVRARTAR